MHTKLGLVQTSALEGEEPHLLANILFENRKWISMPPRFLGHTTYVQIYRETTVHSCRCSHFSPSSVPAKVGVNMALIDISRALHGSRPWTIGGWIQITTVDFKICLPHASVPNCSCRYDILGGQDAAGKICNSHLSQYLWVCWFLLACRLYTDPTDKHDNLGHTSIDCFWTK